MGQFIKENKMIILSSFVTASALYISFGWYSLWNPDSLIRTLYVEDNVWVTQARWGCQLWEMLFRSRYTIPGLSLFWAILFLAVIPIVIIKEFEIKRTGIKFLVIACVMASLHQASTMTYAYCRDEFTMAYLLAVLTAVYLLKAVKKGGRNIRYDVSAIFCLVVSLAIYQSYLSVVLALLAAGFAIYIISDIPAGDCIKSVVRAGMDLVIGVVLYYISVQVSLVVWHTKMSSYRNMDQSWINIKAIPSMIRDAYVSFYYYFFTNQMFFNDFRGKKYLHFLILFLLVAMVIYLVYSARRNMSLWKYFLLVAEMLLAPLFINVVFLMTTSGVSFMMLPGIQYVYVVFAILLSEIWKRNETLSVNISKLKKRILCCVGVPLMLVIYTNTAQIFLMVDALRIEINKSVSVANNLDYAIKTNSDYEKNMKILIVGDYKTGNYPDNWGWNQYYKKILKGTTLEFGQFWFGDESFTMNCWNHIFMNYCGTPYPWCTNDEAKAIISTEEFLEMAVFPEEGSLRAINGVLTIKMSNEPY